MKFFKDEKGSMLVNVFTISIVAIVICAIILEYYNIHTLNENLSTHLQRAVNIAVEDSMLDNYRQEHISKIDPALAEIEVYNYIQESMGLDSNYSSENYRLIIKELNIVDEPPKIELKVAFIYTPLYLKTLIPEGFEFNVKAKSINRRID